VAVHHPSLGYLQLLNHLGSNSIHSAIFSPIKGNQMDSFVIVPQVGMPFLKGVEPSSDIMILRWPLATLTQRMSTAIAAVGTLLERMGHGRNQD